MTVRPSRPIPAVYRTSLAFGILAIFAVAVVAAKFVPGAFGPRRPITSTESAFNQEPTPSPLRVADHQTTSLIS